MTSARKYPAKRLTEQSGVPSNPTIPADGWTSTDVSSTNKIAFPGPGPWDKASYAPSERQALETLMNHGLCKITQKSKDQLERVWKRISSSQAEERSWHSQSNELDCLLRHIGILFRMRMRQWGDGQGGWRSIGGIRGMRLRRQEARAGDWRGIRSSGGMRVVITRKPKGKAATMTVLVLRRFQREWS